MTLIYHLANEVASQDSHHVWSGCQSIHIWFGPVLRMYGSLVSKTRGGTLFYLDLTSTILAPPTHLQPESWSLTLVYDTRFNTVPAHESAHSASDSDHDAIGRYSFNIDL